MKIYRLIYSRESLGDLDELRDYLAHRFSPTAARVYIRRLRAFCAELAIAPHRGERRGHLRPGLRSIGFAGRVSVVFAVFDEEQLVEIEGFEYGGRQRV